LAYVVGGAAARGRREGDHVSILVLLRHGESQWNLENRFTGWVDVPLTERGREEARRAGERLRETSIRFTRCFTSELVRAQETLDIVLRELGAQDLPIERDQALNERHYGDLQGLNKAETAKKFGEEQVHVWRRSYDVAPPGGESLKDTAARTLPYFEQHVVPALEKGENVLVAAHGNSLRSIVMDLEKMTREQVLELNLATGVPIVYELGPGLQIVKKTILQ
jgi:2,3-bisphosphoglycerate-dependent phosphoglycerate mutase